MRTDLQCILELRVCYEYRYPSLYAGVTYQKGTADNATLVLMGNGGLETAELDVEQKFEIKPHLTIKKSLYCI